MADNVVHDYVWSSAWFKSQPHGNDAFIPALEYFMLLRVPSDTKV